MLIPKKNRKLIYETIFKEGVLVAKKDFNAPAHDEIESVPNLQVIKAMQVSITSNLATKKKAFVIFLNFKFKSLKSRGYVKEQFSWQHYYWYLTNEGIILVCFVFLTTPYHFLCT